MWLPYVHMKNYEIWWSLPQCSVNFKTKWHLCLHVNQGRLVTQMVKIKLLAYTITWMWYTMFKIICNLGCYLFMMLWPANNNWQSILKTVLHAINRQACSQWGNVQWNIKSSNTSKEANKLRDQLDRETTTLDERKYVSNNISSSSRGVMMIVIQVFWYMCSLKKPIRINSWSIMHTY